MKDRTRAILELAVRDFIKMGKPITSEYLYELHDFGIKPAMIRWELNDLSEAGYFYQEHASGGRFPTNKAYRYFVDALLTDEADEDEVRSGSDIFSYDMKALVQEMAEKLNVLSVGYDARGGVLYGSGLCELLEHLETDAKEELVDVVSDFESLEERLAKKRDWWEEEDLWPRVFVGESPVTRSDHLSVIAGRYDDHERTILLFSIGPKRMDYQRSVRMFKSLRASNKHKEKNK